MVIYKIENKTDKKIYIGKTARKLEERIKEHIKESSTVYGNSYIDRAIKRCGFDAFEVSVVEECANEDELNEREKFWIAFHKCRRPNGYNLTDGGEGTLGHIVTKETREKLSKSKIGRKSKPHNEETKAKISAANKGHTVSAEVRAILSAKHKGKKLSEETKAKMSAAKKNKRRVRCIESGEIFESIAAAAKWASVAQCTLISVLRKRTFTAGGYHWEYADK